MGDVIVQLTILVIPFFLYDALWLNRVHHKVPKQNGIVVGIISVVSILASLMINPLNVAPYFISFSTLIIMTAILYGGVRTGGAVLSISLIIHYIMDQQNGMIFALSTLLYSIYPFYLSFTWNRLNQKKKMIQVLFITLLYTWIGLCTMLMDVMSQQDQLNEVLHLMVSYSAYSMILIGSMILHIFLREYLLENAELRVKAHNAEKLNIISELAASVAHEVRNPLTVVRGFIQLLEAQERGENKEYMGLVLSELDRAEGIISEYLNLAQSQVEERKLVNLSEDLKEVTTLMSSYALLKGGFVQVDVQKHLLVIGDSARLKQAIINIIKNSIEAIETKKGYIRLTGRREGDNIVIRIKDNGIGMTKEQIGRLGQPYYSLKDKGTGLGLMVTFSIIQAHDGKIWYESDVNRGTEAIIVIPIAPESSAIKELGVKEVKAESIKERYMIT